MLEVSNLRPLISEAAALIVALATLTWAIRGLLGRAGVLFLMYRAQKERRPFWVKDGWLAAEYCTDPTTVSRKREAMQNPSPLPASRTKAQPLTSDPKTG
jgi:hypothetical protein